LSQHSERLFVAVPVPEAVSGQLVALQPAVGTDVRLSAPPDMHVTLHFLGPMDPAAVAAALDRVRVPAFALAPGPLGSFALPGGRHVLWFGIALSAPLQALHSATAEALATLPFSAETRPWVPHITIARLGPRASAGLVTAFLQQPAPVTGFECRSFALYASDPDAGGPRYRQLASWPLSGS